MIPPTLEPMIARVRRQLTECDPFGHQKTRDVTNACCAAYAYGDAYLRSNCDTAYLLAVVAMRRARWSIPMTLIEKAGDPESVSARAAAWCQQYVPRSDR